MAANLSTAAIALTVATLLGLVRTVYISYSIQYDCNGIADRRIVLSDSKSFSSIVLRSNDELTQSDLKCKVTVVGTNAIGFLVTVNKLSLNSSKCDDYLKIGAQHKWCDSGDARSVAIDDQHLDIEFATAANTTADFLMIITAVDGIWNKTCPEGQIRCDGGQQYCIYNGLECDGIQNCPSGSDEKDCPQEPTTSGPTTEPTVSTTEESRPTRRWQTLPLITNSSGVKMSDKLTEMLTKAEKRAETRPTLVTESTYRERQFVLHVSFTRMALVITLLLFIIAFIGGIAVCKYRKHYSGTRFRSVFHYRQLD